MAKGKAKRRKNKGGETWNSPSQREIGGGEPSNPPSPREIGGGEISNPPQEEIGGGQTVIIDTDLLDCSICTNPLCPPLHQCMSGHVVCPSCCSKLKYKCPTCGDPIGDRIIALEKDLESVHLPCTYANLGCPKSVSYSQRQVHTDTCEFGPSSCQIPGCAHKAFSGEWQGHFLKDHRDVILEFLQEDQQLTQLQQQFTQFGIRIDGFTQDCGKERPGLVADLYRLSTEQERLLQNMSTELERQRRNMYIAILCSSMGPTAEGRQFSHDD